jgi:phage-related minor tail protein
VVDGINDTMAQGIKERQQALDNQIEKENHLAAIKEQQRNATAELNRQQVSANIEADKFLETARTNAQIRNDLQTKYQRQLEQGLITQDKFNKLTAAINEKYKDPKTPKTTVPAGDKASDREAAELIALQAQLKVLQQHTGLNDVISQQRKDLWKTGLSSLCWKRRQASASFQKRKSRCWQTKSAFSRLHSKKPF